MIPRWWWVLPGVVWLAAPARADDLASLREQVAALRQEVETLKADLRVARGLADQGPQQLQMYIQEMNRFRQDVDQRLSTVEEQLRLSRPARPSAAAAPAGGPAGAKGDAAGDESLAYQKALSLVHSGNYLDAVATFQQFLQAYPKSPLAPNAQYWIGDCYSTMKDYQRAIKEYQVVVEKYGRHEKANGALWKQGQAFEALGMMPEAKLFWQKLVAKAPNSPEAKKAAERLTGLEATASKYGPPAPAGAPPPKPSAPADHHDIPLAPGVPPPTPAR